MSGSKDLLAVKSELNKLQTDFCKAWAAKDNQKVSKFFHNKACIMPPDVQATFGIAGAANIATREFQRDHVIIKFSTAEIENANDSTLVLERGGYKFSNSDKQIVETGKYIIVWKREDSDLVIYEFIWNRNA